MIENFIQWGKDRDLYNESTALLQFQKYLEEKGELAKAVNKNNVEMIKDAIGDSIVCLVHVLKMSECDFKVAFHGVTPVNIDEMLYSLVSIDKYSMMICNDLISKDVYGISSYVNIVLDYFSTIAEKYDLTLDDCMEHAWNEIKDRKGKFVNGLYVKEGK